MLKSEKFNTFEEYATAEFIKDMMDNFDMTEEETTEMLRSIWEVGRAQALCRTQNVKQKIYISSSVYALVDTEEWDIVSYGVDGAEYSEEFNRDYHFDYSCSDLKDAIQVAMRKDIRDEEFFTELANTILNENKRED